jgi:hypothetical protein
MRDVGSDWIRTNEHKLENLIAQLGCERIELSSCMKCDAVVSKVVSGVDCWWTRLDRCSHGLAKLWLGDWVGEMRVLADSVEVKVVVESARPIHEMEVAVELGDDSGGRVKSVSWWAQMEMMRM